MKSCFAAAIFAAQRQSMSAVLAASLAACTPSQAVDRRRSTPPLPRHWTRTLRYGPRPTGVQVRPPRVGAADKHGAKENIDLAVAAARCAGEPPRPSPSPLVPSLRGRRSATRAGGNSSFPRPTIPSRRDDRQLQAELLRHQILQLQASREIARPARAYCSRVTGHSTSAQVAMRIFTLLAFRERIAIAKCHIAAAKRILAITKAKV